MPVKSVIDIDVKDEKFKEFVASFEKYQTALKNSPNAWAKVTTGTGKAATVMETLLAVFVAKETLEKKSVAHGKDNLSTTAKAATLWQNMAKSSREMSGNVLGITKSLLKWVSIGGVFSGLVGGGGLWGVDRMAEGVAGRRRSSQGLGVTYGEQRAFNIDFGQTVDSNSFLGAVNEKLHSVGGKAELGAMGMSPSQMQGDAAQVGANLLRVLKRVADNTNPEFLTNRMQAFGMDQVIDLPGMLRLKAMSGQDLEGQISHLTSDSAAQNVDTETQTKWAHFIQQMDRAGGQIEKVFVDGLVGFEEPLESLSGSLVKLIAAIGNSETVKNWLKTLSDGLGKFATNIDTDLPKFITYMKSTGGALQDLAHWANKIAHPFTSDPDVWKPSGKYDNLFSSGSDTGSKQADIGGGRVPSAWTAMNGQLFAAMEKKYNLPAGVLDSLWLAESSRGTDPNMGAGGPMQFTEATAKEYHLRDRSSLAESAEAAAHKMSDLLQEFPGELSKALAAYNQGGSTIRGRVAESGDNWFSDMPADKRDYVMKMLQNMANLRTKVDITNSSGGSVIVSSNMLTGGPF